jgi:hypothetical protein
MLKKEHRNCFRLALLQIPSIQKKKAENKLMRTTGYARLDYRKN